MNQGPALHNVEKNNKMLVHRTLKPLPSNLLSDSPEWMCKVGSKVVKQPV